MIKNWKELKYEFKLPEVMLSPHDLEKYLLNIIPPKDLVEILCEILSNDQYIYDEVKKYIDEKETDINAIKDRK